MIDKDRILYEDNHLIVINKRCGELSQADKSGDICLIDEVKAYLKKTYSKPGNVYLGLPHRLDRPTSGCLLFCKTEKALSRMNEAFRKGEVDKTYWAIVDRCPKKEEGRLVHFLVRECESNKSRAYEREVKGSQRAELVYRVLAKSDRYTLLSIELLTGRHHQIRSQLQAEGIHIKGDLKYGADRSNRDGGICLHSRELSFIHPVRKERLVIKAPVPNDRLWEYFEKNAEQE
ncbi:MAG TPA: RNA pseudouridine synthase [Candidatus Ornithospirochaeta avicola]|uniref:RNA pseudouridine synthase n=1 Tax=Candidatus Ornithospirochaeta avicola TaxID=2840896 RepID=A0A9D1PTE2_9SPIO|nr:RNA pseudouridine synthase [Candidatus Ornithospirochaeta avicola]